MQKIVRRFYVLIYCICLSVSLHAQPVPKDDILFWSKTQRLTFADFKARISRDDSAFYKGSSEKLVHKLGSIVKSIDVRVVKEREKTVFTIHAGMKRNLSWIKNHGDTISLKHEQGHFDICEIYARVLRRDIQAATSLSAAEEMYDSLSIAEELEQDDFDKENNFLLGGITPEWEKRIINRLNELERYSNPVVTLPLDNR